jgi:hypothetical protein
MMLVLINAVNSIHYQPMLNAIASMVLDKKKPKLSCSSSIFVERYQKQVQILVDFYNMYWVELECTTG